MRTAVLNSEANYRAAQADYPPSHGRGSTLPIPRRLLQSSIQMLRCDRQIYLPEWTMSFRNRPLPNHTPRERSVLQKRHGNATSSAKHPREIGIICRQPSTLHGPRMNAYMANRFHQLI